MNALSDTPTCRAAAFANTRPILRHVRPITGGKYENGLTVRKKHGELSGDFKTQ